MRFCRQSLFISRFCGVNLPSDIAFLRLVKAAVETKVWNDLKTVLWGSFDYYMNNRRNSCYYTFP